MLGIARLYVLPGEGTVAQEGLLPGCLTRNVRMPTTLKSTPDMRVDAPGSEGDDFGLPEGRSASIEAGPRRADPRPGNDPRPTIAQVVRSLEVGGGELLAARLAERLDRARFRSVVFCLQEPGWLARELEARGVRVVVFGATGSGVKPGLVGRVWSALRRERVAVAHCHNTMPLFYGGFAALAPAPGRSRPALLMTKHGQQIWFGRRQETISRFLLQRATVIAVSGDIHDELATRGWLPDRQLRTILNGIDVERYRPGDGRGAVRDELGWSADEFVAGIVARLSPEKNHAALLRAFQQLLETVPQARLAVIGDGPLRAALEQDAAERRLGDRCRFLGERRDVARLLPALDAFVLSSTTEGTPLTLLEAMAAGLPAVTTRVGGMPEVVVPEETGLLVPPDDAAALAGALGRLAREPETRARMGRAGRRRVVADYSFERMTRDYERLYDELLGRR